MSPSLPSDIDLFSIQLYVLQLQGLHTTIYLSVYTSCNNLVIIKKIIIHIQEELQSGNIQL